MNQRLIQVESRLQRDPRVELDLPALLKFRNFKEVKTLITTCCEERNAQQISAILNSVPTSRDSQAV